MSLWLKSVQFEKNCSADHEGCVCFVYAGEEVVRSDVNRVPFMEKDFENMAKGKCPSVNANVLLLFEIIIIKIIDLLIS